MTTWKPTRKSIVGAGKGAVAALTGLAAAVAAIVTLMTVTGNDPPQPASQKSTVASVVLTDATRMTKGTWAQQNGDDVSDWDPAFRDQPGVLLEYDANVEGVTGKELAVVGFVFDDRSQLVGKSDEDWLKTSVGKDTHPGVVWIDLPPDGGPYEAQVLLYKDAAANERWARSEKLEFR